MALHSAPSGPVSIPPEIACSSIEEHCARFVFPQDIIMLACKNYRFFRDRAIITFERQTAEEINNRILKLLSGGVFINESEFKE